MHHVMDMSNTKNYHDAEEYPAYNRHRQHFMTTSTCMMRVGWANRKAVDRLNLALVAQLANYGAHCQWHSNAPPPQLGTWRRCRLTKAQTTSGLDLVSHSALPFALTSSCSLDQAMEPSTTCNTVPNGVPTPGTRSRERAHLLRACPALS